MIEKKRRIGLIFFFIMIALAMVIMTQNAWPHMVSIWIWYCKEAIDDQIFRSLRHKDWAGSNQV